MVVLGSSLAFAMESWIMGLLGWGVLTLQEMWAWSLLSAHVFYSILCLSTCNLALTGIFPDSKQPQLAYFTVMLCLFIHTVICISDTVQPLEINPTGFRAPGGSNCSLGRVHQVYFFTDSPFFLLQAGNTVGFLIIHLILAAAPVLDTEIRTLWPGHMWGNCLACLLSMRFALLFDASVKGAREVDSQFLYFTFFSEPVQALEVVFMSPILFFLVLLCLQALEYLRPEDLYFTPVIKLVNFGGMLVFNIMSMSIMYTRALLTLPLLLSLLVPLIPAAYGLVQGLLALLHPPSSMSRTQPVPEIAPTAPPAPGMGYHAGGRERQYIPVSIQMDTDKKKGV
jgi:hypothetical protein